MVDLGRPFVGDEARAILTIRSTGRGAVNVTRISASHPELHLEWPGAPKGQLAPSGTLDIAVSWRPTEVQQLTGTIEVELETDDPTERHQVADVTGESRLMPDCDDQNSCTDDSFDKQAEQCRHRATTNSCDDGNACTQDDRCDEGTCRGVARSCDDQNVCTLNLCDPTSGCVFPPDGRLCADDDPCTKDVCDPAGGCQHPNADDGTSCGGLSCAVAHVCVFGACRELDISASSEGYPCSDGDVCTQDDACHAGECRPGPVLDTAPEVVATIDTFGGPGAWVATDGFRYLFVDRESLADDPAGLRVTTWDGQTLKPAGALNLVASAPPVLVAPGRFAVAHGYSVALVDAIDPDHPKVLWDVPVRPETAPAAYFAISALHSMTGGLLVLGESASSAQGGVALFFVPLPDPAVAPMRSVVLAWPSYVADVDASGDTLVYSVPDNVVWMRLDATGHIVNSVVIPVFSDVFRVAVDGNRLAVLGPNELSAFTISSVVREPVLCAGTDTCADLEPGCDGTFPFPAARYQLCTNGPDCPLDAHCESVRAGNAAADADCGRACCDSAVVVCFRPEAPAYAVTAQLDYEGVNDILISNAVLYKATEYGVLRTSLIGGQPQPEPPNNVLDPMPAEGLEHAANNLLVSGPMALAINIGGGVPTRITGAGLGEITALVDQSPTKVLLAGRMSIGELDVPGAQFSKWLTPTEATGPMRARVLNGGHTALVPPDAGAARIVDDACLLTEVEQVAGVDRIGHSSACNLQSSSMAATPGRIWALTPLTPRPIGAMLSSWLLPGARTFPDFSFEDAANQNSIALRADATGTAMGLLQFDYAHSTSRLYSFDVATHVFTGEYGFDADAASHPGDGRALAIDGSVALSAIGASVRLHPLLPISEVPPTPAVELPSLPLMDAYFVPAARVAAMGQGRAWVGWKQGREFSTQTVLTEFRYDPQSMALEDAGSVDVRGFVTSVFDAGQYAVAATNSAVVIVAPGCRRPVVIGGPPVH